MTNSKQALQLELRNANNALRVRLSLAVLSFVKTPLFKGETRQSNFWTPVMDVDTVGEQLVDTLYSGYGRTIFLPGIMRYIACLVSSFEADYILFTNLGAEGRTGMALGCGARNHERASS